MLLIELVLPGGNVGAGEGTWTRDPLTRVCAVRACSLDRLGAGQ